MFLTSLLVSTTVFASNNDPNYPYTKSGSLKPGFTVSQDPRDSMTNQDKKDLIAAWQKIDQDAKKK